MPWNKFIKLVPKTQQYWMCKYKISNNFHEYQWGPEIRVSLNQVKLHKNHHPFTSVFTCSNNHKFK